MLEHVGLRPTRRWRPPRNSPAAAQLPPELSLEVTSRRPLELDDETRAYVLARPIPSVAAPPASPVASVVVPVLDNLACTRLALESVLANTEEPPYEVVVVDNGSGEETRTYLEVLAARNRHVRVIRNDENRGFAAACNQGMAAAAGEILVLLNNDTVVPPGWLSGPGHAPRRCRSRGRRTDDESVWWWSADTDRLRDLRARCSTSPAFAGIGTPASRRSTSMSRRCSALAIRREVFEAVGPLDERFEIGMFEDDDYMRRVRDAGYRVVCANDLFVHHFGEASLGELAGDGRYGELFHANRRRFEEKWGVAWEPHARRNDPAYAALTGRVTDAVREHVPSGATVLVASRGDDTLVDLEDHGPGTSPSSTTGRMPVTTRPTTRRRSRNSSGCASAGRSTSCCRRAPCGGSTTTSASRRHLEDRYPCSSDDPETARIYRLEPQSRRSGGST